MRATVTVLVGIAMTAGVYQLESKVALAYCSYADTCPPGDSSLRVLSVCSDAGTAPACTSTLSTSGHNSWNLAEYRHVVFIPPYYYFYEYFPGTCISGQLHRLRDHAGTIVNHGFVGGQTSDYALCFGAGNDSSNVARSSVGSCGGATALAWDYGAGDYWLELYGGAGRDKFDGSSGHDRLCGGSGDDGNGNASSIPYGLTGHGGADDLDGWTGEDFLNSYNGAGDEAWGYDGSDYVLDREAGTGDVVYGENDADDCVWIDEALGGVTGVLINGGSPGCGPSCVCGIPKDDSCSDNANGVLSPVYGDTYGIETVSVCDFD